MNLKDKSDCDTVWGEITPYEEEQIKRQKMRVVVPPAKATQQFNDGKQLRLAA